MSGIVVIAPVFGGSDVPMVVRALFSFSLSILMMPLLWHYEVIEPATLIDYVLVIGSELTIGLSVGLCVMIFFTGLYLTGSLIGQMGGLMAAQLFDPSSGEQIPILSRFIYLLGITVFACIGGLRVMIAALLDTFETLPPGGGGFHTPLVETILTVLSSGFVLAFRISAPVTIGILTALIVMGLLSKTLPQLNLMSVGFGINNILMLVILMISIGAGVMCFQQSISVVLEEIYYGLHTNINPDLFSM
jgi:flagellar biosynthetic protein FliR